jgi:hypothetical protein
MRRQFVSSWRLHCTRVGALGLIVCAMIACWMLVEQSAPSAGEGPAGQIVSTRDLAGTSPSTPWGAFLRMWQRKQTVDANYAIALPKLVSTRQEGDLATIYYMVQFPEPNPPTWTAIQPRSIRLRHIGGTWVVPNPSTSLLNPLSS